MLYNNSESEQVKLCSIFQYIGDDNEMDRVSKERKLILSPFFRLSLGHCRAFRDEKCG